MSSNPQNLDFIDFFTVTSNLAVQHKSPRTCPWGLFFGVLRNQQKPFSWEQLRSARIRDFREKTE